MTTPDPSFLRARYLNQSSSVQFSSITQLCPTLCNPWTVASQASLSITKSQSLLKLISVELVMPSNYLILCLPLLLLPSIFPSIRVFSNESALCNPMDWSMPGFHVHHQLWSLLKLMSIESVMPSNHLILRRPLLLFHSIFPSIRIFSNESVLCSRWPKYWSFSFSISPSNEYSGPISLRMD